MARGRKNSGGVEGVLDVASALPWWAGLLLAVLAYVVLSFFASWQITISPDPAKAATGVILTVARTVAIIGQYVLPFLILVGTLGGVIRRARRRQLLGSVPDHSAQAAANAIDGLSWRQFEQLVGEAFRLQGFAVSELGGGGPDGGVDLELRRGSELHLVQCKQWRAYKVGVDVVRAHYGVMAARGAAGGYVVTSGRFTADAKRFADGRNLQLIEGEQLQSMIRQARASSALGRAAGLPEVLPSTVAPKPQTVAQRSQMPEVDSRLVDAAPNCPTCGQPMALRTARRGTNAGSQFWGCAEFPRCRGTRAVA
jgi:restriction system protein